MTLREHLEAIRDATVPWADAEPYVLNEHAVAALAILDEAKVTVTFFDYGDLPHEVYRVVPDPEPSA